MSQRQPCDRFASAGVNPHRCSKCGWTKGAHKRKKVVCPRTEKVRYATAAAAKVALHRYLAHPKEPIASAQKMMAYPCPHCHGFHLGHHHRGDDDVAVANPRPVKREAVQA